MPTKSKNKVKPKPKPKPKPTQKQKQSQSVKVSVNIGRSVKGSKQGARSRTQAQTQSTGGIFPTIQLGQPPILPNMIARESNDKLDKEVIKDAVRAATQEFMSQQQPRQTVGLANVSAPIDEYLSQQINQVTTPVARKPTSVKSSPPALQRFTQVYGNPVANRSKASPIASNVGSARSDMFSSIASTPSVKSSSTDRAIRQYRPFPGGKESIEEKAQRMLNNQKIRDKAPKYGIMVASEKDRVDLIVDKIKKAKEKAA